MNQSQHSVCQQHPNDLARVMVKTGCSDKAVMIELPIAATLLAFSPAEARQLGARLLELADQVDGREGLA